MKKNIAFGGYCVFFCIIIFVDRLSKWYAIERIPAGGYRVNSFLSFDLVFNRGISWGLLHHYDTTIFIMVTALIGTILMALIWYTIICYQRSNNIVGHVIASAGALSNFVDRIEFGGVVDFIVLSWNGWTWPIFNAADVAVVCGVGLMWWWYKS